MLLLYETAQDVFLIPHGALGVELSQSYHERTRVFAWQHLFLALGTLCGLGAFALIEAGDARARVQVFALVGGAALAATILFAAWRLPERAEYQGRGARNPWHAFRDVLRNPHARLLLGMYAIETFGAGAIFVLAPYMAQYVYGDASLTTLLAGAYLVPQALLTPVWIALAHRLDKKRLWLASMIVTCCGFFTLTFLPAEMRLPLLGVLFVIGVAAGVGAVCAPAIKADIIDFDEYRTGERKEGAYLAVWNFVRKCSAALTPVLAMGSLQLAGYQPNVEQSEAHQVGDPRLLRIVPGALLRGRDRDLPALPVQPARARRDPQGARCAQVEGAGGLNGQVGPRASGRDGCFPAILALREPEAQEQGRCDDDAGGARGGERTHRSASPSGVASEAIAEKTRSSTASVPRTMAAASAVRSAFRSHPPLRGSKPMRCASSPRPSRMPDISPR